MHYVISSLNSAMGKRKQRLTSYSRYASIR